MKLLSWTALLGGVLLPRALSAQATSDEPPAQEQPPRTEPPSPESQELPSEPKRVQSIHFNGYVQPTLGYLVRSRAVPRDKKALDFSSLLGVILHGKQGGMWTYQAHLVARAGGEFYLEEASLVDREGDGSPEELETVSFEGPKIEIEQLSVGFEPSRLFRVEVGQLRIPFTLANSSVNNKLMFPSRAPTNVIFLSGADLGAQTEGTLVDRRVRLALGVFQGSSLGLEDPTSDSFGPVYSARLDIEPFGELDRKEGSLGDEPFRLGMGSGFLLRRATVFDDTGYGTVTFLDMRASASFRLHVHGFYAQVEFLRRQRTAELTERAQESTGVYGQVAQYFRTRFGQAFQPLLRGGFASFDESFDPRRVLNTEAGLAFYPLADSDEPDGVRLLLQYQGEFRLDEDESAQAGRFQASYQF